MSLTPIVAADPASSRPQEELMEAAIIELQRTKQMVVAGGAAGGSGLTATGLATADAIIGVIYHPASGLPTDVTAEATIPAANKLRLATTATTSGALVVTYVDVA